MRRRAAKQQYVKCLTCPAIQHGRFTGTATDIRHMAERQIFYFLESGISEPEERKSSINHAASSDLFARPAFA